MRRLNFTLLLRKIVAMKRIVLFLYIVFIVQQNSSAQVVNQDVNFDFYQSASNNDFVNNFSGGYGMVVQQNNGITGGCLFMPDSISWGNDNAIYCTWYKPVAGDTTLTSICFKYDSTTVHATSYERAMSIWLRPHADFNHYVIATAAGNKKIELITYGWVNTPYPNLNLLNGHWYKYNLSVAFFAATFNVYIRADVFDLGVAGTSTPVFVNSSSGNITDNILAVDTAIQVSVTGAAFGGGTYLDNFHFHGGKGISNCIITGRVESENKKAVTVFPSVVKNTLHIFKNYFSSENLNVIVFNSRGEKIMERNSSQAKLDVDFYAVANGVYLIQCITENELRNYKIVVAK
jgi:hypothetical protein